MLSAQQLGVLVDEYAEIRDRRLAMQRETDKLDKKEKELKQQIMAEIKAASISSIGGRIMRGTIHTKQKPVASSWPDIYKHIQATGEFDLLQRRLTETAVLVRWEDKIVIPGIQAFPVDDLSLSKI